ncbi:MAG: SDR family NAD(P)-dependent oxidoreductase [Saprospiraceae bacterium]|nr:SDR family NAD(P)-dependent oxidoreductase [Saprospiraceae bacterium]MDW8228275.1 SDR family NAD(P)-dependent oxidoreductase [Saprospiraceae bacterium]
MQIRDKTFIVTGAGSGIGQQLSLLLIQKGARVIGLDLREASLAQTKTLAGGDDARFRGVALDVSNLERVQSFAAEAPSIFGGVDGLINNAGIIQPFQPVNELSLEAIHRVMNVNFYGVVYLTKALLPHLLERPEAHIANVSSMGGFLPVPGQSVYGASKAAVKLFTEGLYAELLHTRVRVTIVMPGAVATNIVENSGIEAPPASGNSSRFKALPADKAAAIIVRAIEKNAFRVLVGSDASFMDRLYRLAPRYAVHFITRQMQSLLKK